MPRTFTLSAPLTVGDLTDRRTINSLRITSLWYSSTPDLAPSGTGELEITLTEPDTGKQHKVCYQDASVLLMWRIIGDTVVQALFAKLIADGKLPDGALSVTGS
jgi:hypothetical protein